MQFLGAQKQHRLDESSANHCDPSTSKGGSPNKTTLELSTRSVSTGERTLDRTKERNEPMKSIEDESLLTKAAKAIGSAAGKVCAAVGGATRGEQPDFTIRSTSKLLKKPKSQEPKSRLPRKQKKTTLKTAKRTASPERNEVEGKQLRLRMA
jgi:hypothetical protein